MRIIKFFEEYLQLWKDSTVWKGKYLTNANNEASSKKAMYVYKWIQSGICPF